MKSELKPLFCSMGLTKEHFNKSIMSEFKKGDELKIKDSCKEELITSYESRSGMSGVSQEDINETFLFIDNDSSNFRVSIKDEPSKIISLNHSRFIKI